MAEKTHDLADGVGGGVAVSSGAAMPPVEPGHKGYELIGGESIFDPNAALRHAQGRGPGLQDSEIKNPAYWPQPVSPLVALEAEVDQAEARLAAAKKNLAEAKK